jgi:alpha-galactosidase
MKDVVARLGRISPDVLIEFRQQYMGPAIRQYGNMIRATDCPADLAANRRRVADLRLTSGSTAVHSDMLVWSADETPENAARAVLSAIFGVVQYSMVLQRLPESHCRMMRHWIDFSRIHRDALLKDGFRPHHPEMQYPWIESWNDKEHIVSAYSDGIVLSADAREKTAYAINASQVPSLVLDVADDQTLADVFDTFGTFVRRQKLEAGLNRISVPVGGYIRMETAK